VLQRFGYRQLLYYVLSKSVASAAKGHFVGWGKLDRKATLVVPPQRAAAQDQIPGAPAPLSSPGPARQDVDETSDAA
jgi:hypothetical protein